MQAIFGFRGNALADWNQQVCAHFPVVGELATPWRWRNAGAEALGQWLLEARRLLAAGQSVDLRSGPPEHVTWMQAVPPNDHAQRLAAARTASPTADGRVLIIADSRNRAAQQNFASQTPGASTVEAVDLQDLIAFASSFDVGAANALGQLLALAQSVMTNVGVAELTRRLESLAKGTARNPPNEAESRALAFGRAPSLAQPPRCCRSCGHCRTCVCIGRPFSTGCSRRSEKPRRGPSLWRKRPGACGKRTGCWGARYPNVPSAARCCSRGWKPKCGAAEYEGMSAQHLYVAMTRGSMKLVVCSASPVIG
jgi:hypothetical protein